MLSHEIKSLCTTKEIEVNEQGPKNGIKSFSDTYLTENLCLEYKKTQILNTKKKITQQKVGYRTEQDTVKRINSLSKE